MLIPRNIFPKTSKDFKYWLLYPYGDAQTTMWTIDFMDGFIQHPDISTLVAAGELETFKSIQVYNLG